MKSNDTKAKKEALLQERSQLRNMAQSLTQQLDWYIEKELASYLHTLLENPAVINLSGQIDQLTIRLLTNAQQLDELSARKAK